VSDELGQNRNAPGGCGLSAGDVSFDSVLLAFSDEFRRDPYPAFDWLRQNDPVHHAAFGVWLFTRHSDVERILRDASLSNRNRSVDLNDPGMSAISGIADDVILNLDPPAHTRVRGSISKAFSPRRAVEFRPRIEATATALLDAAVERDDGIVDVIGDLAYPLPMSVMCSMLDVPLADRHNLKALSRDLVLLTEPPVLRTAEQEARLEPAVLFFVDYFREIVAERRTRPREDVLSALITARHDGNRLSESELLSTLIFLFLAGHHTTSGLIGNGLMAMFEQPEQFRRLREDPTIGGTFVEELLRYDAPVQLARRITVDDYEIGDVRIPTGEMLIPLLGAANRDPSVFTDPDRLDLGRANAHRNVAFGGGPHHCLGSALARLEGEVALREFARRFRRIELAGEPRRSLSFTVRGFENLPMQVTPA
jgi:cytochrome P450